MTDADALRKARDALAGISWCKPKNVLGLQEWERQAWGRVERVLCEINSRRIIGSVAESNVTTVDAAPLDSEQALRKAIKVLSDSIS